MSASVAVAVVTIFWLCFGIGGPLLVYMCNKFRWYKTDPNTEVVIVMLVLVAVCCWLFWFLQFLAQYKPLIGPRLSLNSTCIIQCQWFGKCEPAPQYCPRYS